MMRYSLLNQFQGTLLGVVLGESLGNHCISHITQSGLSLSQLRQMPLSLDSHRWSSTPQCYGTVLLQQVNSLIRWNGLNLEDWQQVLQQAVSGETGYSAEDMLLLSAIPLALFFHDEPTKTHQYLQQVARIDQAERRIQSTEAMRSSFAARTIAYTLSCILTHTLYPLHLIPSLLADLEFELLALGQEPEANPLLPLLHRVQTLLVQNAGLDSAIAHFGKVPQPNTAIALAFYCFLSTPSDFRLSTLRAIRTGYQLPLTVALTASLSAAYNPVIVTLDWGDMEAASSTVPPVTVKDQVIQAADRLFAAWCGVYDPSQVSQQVPAVAAPNVIRPRLL